MGWNSWDYFGTTLNEAQAREQADAMAAALKPAGYDVFTVDIQWYEPNAQGHDYKEGAPLELDAYSRLQPAVKKFPSAAQGAGFKPLADYVHSKGLRFGIHIMRGIARQAVRNNTAIFGTTARAADIADTRSTCSWNPDMYGVDLTKPGAQEYYDSLFALYAAWGVDFVKVDDIARPYDDVQRREIEAIRRAIDKTGRPIVLSLSPGDTPIERGEHVMRHANLWRISDDFWDRWEPLHGMFGRLDKWTRHRAAGAWPDADMLPFGLVEFGRPTRFTQDEQTTCMTLWCIARSPPPRRASRRTTSGDEPSGTGRIVCRHCAGCRSSAALRVSSRISWRCSCGWRQAWRSSPTLSTPVKAWRHWGGPSSA